MIKKGKLEWVDAEIHNLERWIDAGKYQGEEGLAMVRRLNELKELKAHNNKLNNN